ncbi:unnamed protein product [Prorocentrum cordatum]|uniref:Uncharacterized protein n=1 Tax=Prorocentrum cordatum TaxID=2364126 RepID=A0ABN9SQR5_9DINO|nr:unnamed protein product [Polarella glacialis]
MGGSFRPLEELLQAEPAGASAAERGPRWELPPSAPAAAAASDGGAYGGTAGRATHTARLVALASEPWVYTIARLLLQETSARESAGGLRTAAAARAAYEPALLRQLRALLRARADPDGGGCDAAGAPGGARRTPLMCLAAEGCSAAVFGGRQLSGTDTVTFVRALLAARADARRADAAGRTALHCAVIQQELRVAGQLLRAGADPSARDAWGHSLVRGGGACCDEAEPAVMELPPPASRTDQRASCWGGGARGFVRDFATVRRPLLLRGGAERLLDRQRWCPEELARRAGASQVQGRRLQLRVDVDPVDAEPACGLASQVHKGARARRRGFGIELRAYVQRGGMNEQQADETMAGLARQLQEQSGALQAAVQQNADFLKAEGASRRREGMVDSRPVQKPATFSGKESDWADWAYKFVTLLASNCAATITDDRIDDIVDEFFKVVELNRELHAILTSFMTDGTTAFDIINNTRKTSGLDGWRQLNKNYDSRNPSANLRKLRKILRPAQVSTDQLLSAIEQWEQHYMSFNSMCPDVLSNHLDLSVSRLLTYELLKQEIERYVEQTVARNGPTPMEIGSIGPKGAPKGKGKGKAEDGGKGKGKDGGGGDGQSAGRGQQQFQGCCGWCWRWGHKRADCCSRTDANGQQLPPREPGGQSDPKGGEPAGTPKGARGGGRGGGSREPSEANTQEGALGAGGEVGSLFVVERGPEQQERQEKEGQESKEGEADYSNKEATRKTYSSKRAEAKAQRENDQLQHEHGDGRMGSWRHSLSSASKMAKYGSCVWFDSEENGGGGSFHYQTGQTMEIFEKDGIYVLLAWVEKPDRHRAQGVTRGSVAASCLQPPADGGRMTAPPKLMLKMIEDHVASHLPAMSRRAACARGRAKTRPHFKQDKSREVHSTHSVDYGFFGVPGEVPFEAAVGKELPALAGHDLKAKCPFARPNPRGGSGKDGVASLCPAKVLAADLGRPACERVNVKGDQENSITVVVREEKEIWAGEVVIERPLMCEQASNGGAERAAQSIHGRARTLEEHVEGPVHLRYIYTRGEDGMAPFQRAQGKSMAFQKRTRHKLEARWERGSFHGVKALSKLRGLPWEPAPDGRDDQRTLDVPGAAELPPHSPMAPKVPTEAAEHAKGMRKHCGSRPEARAENVEFIDSTGLWGVVPRPAGHRAIGARWVDDNAGDEVDLQVRSRLVAKEIRHQGLKGKCALQLLDVKKAHVWAMAERSWFVELPEDYKQVRGITGDMVYRFLRSTHGARDAAALWETLVVSKMKSLGLRQGTPPPRAVWHPLRDPELSKEWAVKVEEVYGPPCEPDTAQSIRTLNRLLSWTPDGMKWECYPRRVQIIVRELGLGHAGVKLATPGLKEKLESVEVDDVEIPADERTWYRSSCMRLAHIAQDRPDLGVAARELAKGTKCPTERHAYRLGANVDATAAIGMVSRGGVGKTKPTDTVSLWAQEAIDRLNVDLRRRGTDEMLADLLTKFLLRGKTERSAAGPDSTRSRL